MASEIRVPTLGESITEATIGKWFKKVGDAVAVDEPLVELETDKVTLEVPSPSAGVLSEILANDGDTVEVNALLGSVDSAAKAKSCDGKAKDKDQAEEKDDAPKETAKADEVIPKDEPSDNHADDMPASPAAAKILAEHDLSADEIEGTGKRGQVLKEDVLSALDGRVDETAPASTATQEAPKAAAAAVAAASTVTQSAGDDNAEGREERVRMTKLRQTIAHRLKAAQNTAAMLTTFNEVDMSHIMNLRKDYKELFEKKHGIKLGFMGFFTKAVIQALKDVPAVNAEVDGTDMVFKNYYNIGIAVGTEKGLVVPVVRDADQLSIAGVEKAITGFGKKARDGKLTIADMQGGTFTMSNGGVYGSLMSTPILNSPQSGILGMHKIQERPVAINGAVEIRPMMYLALSYDHRIVDGKEAVTFLVRVKDAIEDPQRLILDL